MPTLFASSSTLIAPDVRRDRPRVDAVVHGPSTAWWHERADADHAIGRAAEAEDWEALARLVADELPIASWDGRADAVDRWLGLVPAAVVRATPGLQLAQASNELARGHVMRAAHLASSATPFPAAGVLAAIALDDPRAMACAARNAGSGLAQGSAWRGVADLIEGAGHFVAGDLAAATEVLERGARHSLATSPVIAAWCEAQLGVALMLAGAWDRGTAYANRARGRLAAARPGQLPGLALVPAAAALARTHAGRFDEAQVDLVQARALQRRAADLPPWWDAMLRLIVVRCRLRQGELGVARADLEAVDRLLGGVGSADGLREIGCAAHADLRRLASAALSDPLTTAELRVLRILPSHLSFREIGGRLNVSANTIKSQAHAVYRKLDATSRSAAVDRAVELGLIDVPPWERVDG